ncbi:hypothetical protein AAZX31_01G134300 [Glycine max]|uniref:Uncharacterized protein n=2 Tax=Glycine subgen. Soja TaxID=1462606 RepID=I1L9Z7_SOYBN|nr:uncharacterized protein LOC100803544 [Glycine max]XP_006588931.1 uncharacterized protein LOC100806623 [Glycine max]XP_028185720.1 uncharacterized protein LOC114372393 [Glycine soja]XP_028239045.1 uncharacterized protein LOC114418082 [Glycine soja]KAG4982900.1 hypothetical protein JHK87_027649 [Glycine soja]KAG5060747.1 hypothetical protein JHK87_001776 [Glycine soja]KAH1137759.1 hypothetical protein GYH30_027663 [Glycine max]KAH1163122.1 hypothetical protein GYH30_001595 [Glycine max]KHN|eukprot:XP_006573460.1 uncharacterized protein LOC100803544 [Glycine max]
MPSPVQPSHSPSSAEGEKHARKQLDREIRDMVSAITDRVTDFHKPGSTNHMENDGEHGLSMVTLVGNNNGATMKSEFDEKSGNPSHGDEPEALSTYVNSNFQAINNSVMLGGSYQTNDPGVHMDISDFSTEHEQHHRSHYQKEEKHGKKGKKIEKKASKSRHLSSSSSEDSD